MVILAENHGINPASYDRQKYDMDTHIFPVFSVSIL
jgi:hypothetical protein